MAAVVAVLMVLVATVATVSADESLGELEFSIGLPRAVKHWSLRSLQVKLDSLVKSLCRPN